MSVLLLFIHHAHTHMVCFSRVYTFCVENAPKLFSAGNWPSDSLKGGNNFRFQLLGLFPFSAGPLLAGSRA